MQTPINSRQEAKKNYYHNTGQKVRVPEYQTNFLQPPQVAPGIKPPSLDKNKNIKPIFFTPPPPDPKKLWKKALKPSLQQPNKKTVKTQSPEEIIKNNQISQGSVTGAIGDSQQTYIPETTESRQLSNTIYQGVVKSQQHLVPFINQNVIEKVLSHFNISDSNQINREKLLKLFGVFNNIADKLREKSLHETPALNTMGSMSGGQAVGDEMYDRNTKREVYTVCIDSNDRYRQYWPNSNEYQILFGVNPNILGGEDVNKYGKISRSFISVKEIQLTNVILEPTEKLSRGYILLHID